ncbi:hypothetical protein IWW47_003695 [Coemansia sp. RSA 2052]|nr:hypothetical protein IWW47_003695 [Coemansia sp. RSA 2052]
MPLPNSNELSGKAAERSPEYEYEEEEHYVIAALPANALKQAYDAADKAGNEDEPHQPHYALVDIGSDQPMLELEGSIYRGTSDELLGTALFFDSGSGEAGPDKPSAELIAKTSRVITFYPVAVSRK